MSSRGPEGVSAAELYSSLQLLAARLTAQGHPLEAIKCYVAMLSQSLLPSDEAAARLRLGQLLLEHTLNVQDARLNLQKAVGGRCCCSVFKRLNSSPASSQPSNPPTSGPFLQVSMLLQPHMELLVLRCCRKCWSCPCPASTC